MTATVFFCDISGTLDGKKENSILDYETFSNLILKIKNQNHSEHLIFSLVSSDNSDIVKQRLHTLTTYMSESIIFDKQFFDKGYTNGEIVTTGPQGKCIQIINYLNELSENYSIDDVIIADDLELNHEMIGIMSERYSWKDKISSIIPTEQQGLIELNELLSNYLHSRKKMKYLLQTDSHVIL